MSAASIGALLNNVPTPWAVAFATLLAGVTYDLTTMCTTDPPALVTMTGADMLDLVAGPAGGVPYLNAVAKFYNFVKYWAWFQFCECSAVATPAPAAPPAAPANLPNVAPPIPLLTAGPCDHYASPEVGPLSNTSNTGLVNAPGLFNLHPLPIGATSLVFTVKNIATGATPGPYSFLLRAYTTLNPASEVSVGAAFGVDSVYNRIVASGGTATYTVPVVGTWSAITLEVGRETSGQISNHAQATMDVYCNGAKPGQTVTPCCPPDPVQQGLLTQILQAVTLIQRQAVPFAYLPSTVHAGLSGTGTLSIQGLIGASISITTLPSQLGRAGTTPLEIFDAGFVTFGTADGYPTSYRLEHNPQLLLPARCSAYTDLAYDLHPGVVITITELVREP